MTFISWEALSMIRETPSFQITKKINKHDYIFLSKMAHRIIICKLYVSIKFYKINYYK